MASFLQRLTDILDAQAAGYESEGAQMSERVETLKKARERMREERDAHAKVLAAPFDRDKAERARGKFTEIQALIEALDRAISGEEVIAAKG
jgi:acyl-CoA reductase-like NAD-dependent aldehyde dehydrogenase